jgi:hypothetical protein
MLATFFHYAQLPHKRSHLHQGSNQGQFFKVLVFVSALSLQSNNFGLGVVLRCSVSELQKPSSLVIELRTASRGYGLCFSDLFEANNYDHTAILPSHLVFKLQETSLSGLKTKMFSSWSQGISKPSFVQIRVSVLEI